MGLAVEVGILSQLRRVDEEGGAYYRDLFLQLNGWLPQEGLRPHNEPDTLPKGSGYSCGMFGYSGLHTLRRIAAYLQMREELPDDGAWRDAAKDPVTEEFYEEFNLGGSRFDHLMMHSDAEGFYLPQDFAKVLFPPDSLKIPGCMIGSAPELLAECLELAEAMELPPEEDPESDDLSDLLSKEEIEEKGWRQFPVEAHTCLHLIRACRSSIATGAAIVFA